ncbi:hypothetical protein BDP27DRAFT_1431296 [Rhodocollybia butyracea]|uniref:ZZ-type domain-containing protein n=1 Tax=Rhodocollybia butyracea TaxID=206335 RepID=A0A9P5PAA9_9AGAR|nr:hypothetical protein BDP27DRAFT_1431296 [Rhodocollybia butyracea]
MPCNLSPDLVMKSFAGGLYRHALQESDVFTPQKLKELDNSSSIETLNVPDMRIISLEWSPRSKEPEEVVNLPSDDDCDVGSSDPTVTFLDASDWLERLQTCTPSDDPTPLILGEWSGYTTAPGYNEMQHYVFKPSPSGFQGLGQYYRGENFSLSGNCIFDPSGKINITFNKTYTDESYYSFRYTGVLDRDSGVFSGTFKAVMEPEEEEGEGYEFTFRRVSPEILSRRPPLLDFNANRPQALWHFATSVTLDHLKRTSWSTAYFANRFTTRKRCMDLFLMREIHGSDTTAGVELFRTIVPREFQYYWRLFQKRREQMLGQCPHHEVLCDVCGFSIIGPRITCLECPRADIGRVDLCPTLNCISTDVTWSRLRQQQRSHSACHALLRLTSVLHKGVEALTLDNAKHAVERAKQLVVDEDEAKEEKDPQAVLQRTAPTAKASRPELRCAVCHNTLGSSFWYCADCEETVVLCEKCGVEEIHHDTHLLVRYSKVKEASRDIASSFDQQFSAFQRKMESSFDQQSLAFQRKTESALSNMRKEITEELQSVQNEVQYKLDRIERLLLKIAGEREEGISDPV